MNMMTTIIPDEPALSRRSKLRYLFAAFDRDDMEAGVDLLLERLDAIDGDPDREEPGLEDSFVAHIADGPGCPLSDADHITWTEWQTRGAFKLDAYGAELFGRDRYGNHLMEDIEDDDAAEADGDEADDSLAEDGFARADGNGPGCPLDDPGGAGWRETHGKRSMAGAGREEDDEPRHVSAEMVHLYAEGEA